MPERPKWMVDDMIEKLAKIQAEVKYAQIIKIQNNIQNNSGITSAGWKDQCQVDKCQTYEVKCLSAWISEQETYRVDFLVVSAFHLVKNMFFASISFSG